VQQREKRKAIETANKMLADGMSVEMVLEYTGLTMVDLND